MSEWISVKERMPKKFDRVIVYRESRRVGNRVELGYADVNGWWHSGSTRTKSVTHWMPLPEPPEREGNDG